MIVYAHAVIYPGAVVVEPLATPVADRAVLRTRRTQHLTVGAHFARVHLLEQVEEAMGRSQVARIADRR